jgi:hydrogenase maturation factor
MESSAPPGTSDATFGKIAPDVFARLIAPHLGAVRPEVIAGPRAGHDCAIVRAGAGRVLAITTDPLSIIPAIGVEASARLACHLLASDLWTSGIPPAYATVDLNLPPQFDDGALGIYARALGEEFETLGVAIVAGHTGRYPAVPDPAHSVIGAATLIGLGDEGRYVIPSMAAPGDRVLVTKGCAIEATAIAAHLIPGGFRRALVDLGMDERESVAALDRARAMLREVSVVADCRAAIGVGVRDRGVTALHDATEGGVLGGLLELAQACGHDLRVDQAKIPCTAEARAACAALGGIDPYWTLSEGALVAVARPEHARAVLRAFAEHDIAAAEVGEVVAGTGRLWLTDAAGSVRGIEHPQPDPYWEAYARISSSRATDR